MKEFSGLIGAGLAGCLGLVVYLVFYFAMLAGIVYVVLFLLRHFGVIG